jgi:hypothetical protein
MDARMRTRIISGFLISLASLASAQSKGAIEKKLAADFAPTQATADFTDIVTAGAILVLKQGNIVMGPAYQSNSFLSTYKDGKLTANLAGKLNNFNTRMSRMPGSTAPPPTTRTFVPGEKMWVTKIECKDDGVMFDLFTDAYAEVRYKGALKFAFDKKGAMPSGEQMSKLVGEVFKVQPGDDQQQAPTEAPQQQAAPAPARGRAAVQPVRQQAPAPAAEAPLAPIPPPPPPADDAPPKTISLGQTTDQVIGNFGQPEKKVKLGAKEIYYYKDIKVTFVNGKVSDVQ